MAADADEPRAVVVVEDELQRFREQWKQELRAPSSSAPTAATASTSPSTSTLPLAPSAGSDAYKALFAYTRAVLAERKHDLNTALEAYKRAFRLHEQPDRLYHRACAVLLDAESSSSSAGAADALALKGKAKKGAGGEVASLLDAQLTALLRASLEPSTDDDASSVKARQPVKAVASTPRTSPTAPVKPLHDPRATRDAPAQGSDPSNIPPAPSIADPTPAPSSSSEARTAPDRYLVTRSAPKVKQKTASLEFTNVNSTNTLLPILEQLVLNPRPDRETLLARARQADGASRTAVTISKSTTVVTASDGAIQDSSIVKKMQDVGDPKSSSSSATPRRAPPLVFQPRDEDQPCPLTRLPDELLLAIAMEVARPRGKRGDKLPLPIGLHSVPGAPTLGAALTAREKEGGIGSGKAVTQHHVHDTHSSGGGVAHSHGSAGGQDYGHGHGHGHGHVHHHPLGLAVNLALPDVTSLEALGRTCAKWRVLTSGAASLGAGGEGWGVWRLIVRATLRPPLLPALREPQHDVLLRALYKAHSHDWRTLYLEHPRLRLNGVYAAACRYTRPGMSEENVWVAVIHVVEFFRSLRLLPDGTALSLLTTEPPAETVRRMEPGWRRKGMCVGRWRFFPFGLPDEARRRARRRVQGARRRGGRTLLDEGEGGPGGQQDEENGLALGLDNLLLEDACGGAEPGLVTAVPEDNALVPTDEDEDEDEDTFYEYDSDDELDALHQAVSTASRPPPKLILSDLRDRTLPKYAFRMVFTLKSTQRGRWNRLELETYESIHLGNGERLGLPLTHTKPFVFSLVRSYGTG